MAGGSSSKTKGASAERALGKILGEALGGNFMRSNNSGAYVGGKNAHRRGVMSTSQILSTKGDLVPPDHLPRLVVESKHYANLAYHQMLTGPLPLLDGWIAQTLHCVDPGDVWIVCFKTDRRPWMIVFDAAHENDFDLRQHSIYYTAKDQKCIALGLLEFLERNTDALKRLCAQ